MTSDRTELRQSLRDAALLVLLLVLLAGVRSGRPKPPLNLDLGRAQAAGGASLPAEHEAAAPNVLSLPTTPESAEPECGNEQGPKDRLSRKTLTAFWTGYQEPRG